MKSRIIGVALTLVLAISLAGCQKEPQQEQEQADSSLQERPLVSEESGVPPEDASSMLVDPGIETKGQIDAYLDSFAAQLAESGLTLDGKAVKDAESIGAFEGYGFQVNGSPFEIYLFDPDVNDEKTTENLKTADEEGYITIYGVEINGETPKADCAVHDNLVLIFPAEAFGISHPNKEEIVNAFMKASM